MLVRGRKRWFLFPPTQTKWGNDYKLAVTGSPIVEWVLEDLPQLKEKGLQPFEFIQEEGEVVYVIL